MALARGLAKNSKWFEELPCSIMVCDKNYKILYMNNKAAETAAKDGGRSLIGKSMLDCHPPEAQRRLRQVMASKQPNIYTVERNGVKKMVFHGHWKQKGMLGGIVELTYELPREVPHHVRH